MINNVPFLLDAYFNISEIGMHFTIDGKLDPESAIMDVS